MQQVFVAATLAPLIIERLVVPTFMALRARSAAAASSTGGQARSQAGGASTPISQWPSVSVIVPANNEAETIAGKVVNIVEHDYPGELEVIVSNDGSTDDTADEARKAGAKVVTGMPRQGKTAAMARGMANGDSEIVVFSDASSRWQPGSLRALIESMLRHDWHCAGGRYVAAGSDSALSWYLDFESRMRVREAQTGEVLCLSGSVMAFRRSCLPTLPAGIINDDLWIPLEIRRRGGRVGYEPTCEARDVSSTTDVGEFWRRARIWAGNLAVAGQLASAGNWGLFAHLCTRRLGRLVAMWSALGVFLSLPWAFVAGVLIVTPAVLVMSGFLRRLAHAIAGALISPLFLAFGNHRLTKWHRDDQVL